MARIRAWASLVVGLALLTAFVTVVTVQQNGADRLLRDGVHTPGVVVGYGYSRDYSHINVQYVRDGQVRMSRIWIGDSGHRYSLGEPVEVVYDPRDPGHVRTTKETNERPGPTWALVFAFVLGGAFTWFGVVLLRRLPRWRRLLSVVPWRRWEARHTHSAWGEGIELRRGGDEDWTRLKVGGTTKWRYDSLRRLTQVWVAGALPGDVVIAPVGGADLFAAGPPHGIFGRLWSRASHQLVTPNGPITPAEGEKRYRVLRRAFLASIAFHLGAGGLLVWLRIPIWEVALVALPGIVTATVLLSNLRGQLRTP